MKLLTTSALRDWIVLVVIGSIAAPARAHDPQRLTCAAALKRTYVDGEISGCEQVESPAHTGRFDQSAVFPQRRMNGRSGKIVIPCP